MHSEWQSKSAGLNYRVVNDRQMRSCESTDIRWKIYCDKNVNFEIKIKRGRVRGQGHLSPLSIFDALIIVSVRDWNSTLKLMRMLIHTTADHLAVVTKVLQRINKWIISLPPHRTLQQHSELHVDQPQTSVTSCATLYSCDLKPLHESESCLLLIMAGDRELFHVLSWNR